MENPEIPEKKSLTKKIGTYLFYGGLIGTAAFNIPTLLGFGSLGIVKGSIAAGVQSGIGNVASGSIFAKMTSIGMQGFFDVGTLYSEITAVSGAVVKYFPKTGKNPDGNSEKNILENSHIKMENPEIPEKKSLTKKIGTYLFYGGLIGAAALNAPTLLGFGSLGIIKGSIAAGGMQGYFGVGTLYLGIAAVSGVVVNLFSKKGKDEDGNAEIAYASN